MLTPAVLVRIGKRHNKLVGSALRCCANSHFISRTGVSLFSSSSSAASFVFSPENFKAPTLPKGLEIKDVPLTRAKSNADLEGYGYLVDNPDDFTCEKKTFEIVPWPVQGWRKLDPETGDEAGTVEGDFEVEWKGDFFYGKNLAIASVANHYLEGILCTDAANATHDEPGYGMTEEAANFGNAIHLWMTDYHPDGGQLFFPTNPTNPVPFYVCLGLNSLGDDIKPTDMRAFEIPAGKGVYIHPGTWHNGVQLNKKYGPQRFFTRQGNVHARVSASWASEFNVLLRMPLQ